MSWMPSRLVTNCWVILALAVGYPSAVGAAELSGATHHVTNIRLGAAGDVTRVVVDLDSSPTFSARLDRGGLRLVVDIRDAELKGANDALTEAVGLVEGVLAQSFVTEGGTTTRLLVTFSKRCEYSIRSDAKRLVISVAGQESALGATPATIADKAPISSEQNARVGDVRFSHQSSHDAVEIDLSSLPKFSRVVRSKTRTRIRLTGTSVPKALERVLDVSAFAGQVQSITTYVDPSSANGVLIDVEHREGLEQTVEKRGRSLVWEFYPSGMTPSSVSGRAQDGGTARRTRTVAVEQLPVGLNHGAGGEATGVSELAEHELVPSEASAFTPPMLGQDERYAGGRVDLDLKDSDIHNVLRLLAEIGRVNVVTSDDVKGSVTLRMRNVPWMQALDVILQSKGLGKDQQGNMIRVAPLEVLAKERELAVERARADMQLAPLETRLVPISYADAAALQPRARELLSSRGTVSVEPRTNVLIARDLSGNLDQVEELIRALDTQTPQVLVEARIVEATSRYLRDVGIQWGGDGTFSAVTGNPTGLAFPNSVGIAGGATDGQTPTAGLSAFNQTVENPNFAVNLPAAVGTGQGGAIGLNLGSIDNTVNLAVRLSAAESSGMLRIISSPRVLTLDNRTARISQGTLLPYSQISANGVQTTFQEAKLQLLVKPHVTAEGSVSMQVKVNRDEPDFNQTSAGGDPTILKREAETELLVMDGHTAVIGGIFSRNTGRNLDQVPFFGDIPLLGLLFQRRRSSDSRSELVIFLTPRIVNRAEALGR